LIALFSESADIDACKRIDNYLGLKDRVLSWYLLQRKKPNTDIRTKLIQSQAEPVVANCDLKLVTKTNLSSNDWVKIVLILLIFTFTLSWSLSKKFLTVTKNSTVISKLEEAIRDAQVPPEIKEKLTEVAEAIKGNASTQKIDSLVNQALSTIEAFDSNVKSVANSETIPATTDSLSPTMSPIPTPTPTSTPTMPAIEKNKNSDQKTDVQNTASSKNQKPSKDSPKDKNQASQDGKNAPNSTPKDIKESSGSEKKKNSDSKNQSSKNPADKDKGKDSEDKKKNEGGNKEKEQSDKSEDANDGKEQNSKNSAESDKNQSGEKPSKDSESGKKDGEGKAPKGKQPQQEGEKSDQLGKEGKPDNKGEPSQKQEQGGAKSELAPALQQAKEALNQLKAQIPEKNSPQQNSGEIKEKGEVAEKSKPNENSKKSESSQHQKGQSFGKKDSELALETEEKKGNGDKPNLSSSTKYKDELITIKEGKIDLKQVGKSTGTKELPKGNTPKTLQKEVAIPLVPLNDEKMKQRIPLEYEHLLRE